MNRDFIKTKFVTFYSYKGGVGRTLAVGNVAWRAALEGKKVVIIDFDLEAPGIPSIIPFRKPVKEHLENSRKSGGLFELILSFQKNQFMPSISDFYATEPIPIGKGEIFIIPAGKEDSRYIKNLQSFNWDHFYEKENGWEFFIRLRENIIFEFENPDFVFIDSRTGLTDTGSICTNILPDKVVVLTGLNHQNVQGCNAVIGGIEKYSEENRKGAETLDPIEIVIVASHVPDNVEVDLCKKKLSEAEGVLKRKIDVVFPYMPVLSLEERVLFDDKAVKEESPASLAARYVELYELINTADLEIYFEWVINRYQNIDTEKLHSKGQIIPLILPEVFIPLYANKPFKKSDKDPPHYVKEKPTIDIETLIAEKEYLLIEGEAGSGKTTLLKHVAYSLCLNEKLPYQLDGLKGLFPLLILLRDLNGFFEERVKSSTTGTVTAQQILEWYLQYKMENVLHIETLNKYIKSEKALILLDGLDEIQPEYRDSIINCFTGFRIEKKIKVIFTGRPHALEGSAVKMLGENRIKILELNIEQIEEFIDKWFDSMYQKSPQTGRKNAKAMISEIRENPKIYELVKTPLILTAICILYNDGKELPEQRAELYTKFINNLLYRKFKKPENEKVHDYLKTLAFRMHEKGVSGVDRNFAIEVLKEIYLKEDKEIEEIYKKRIINLFDDIEPNCGLFKFKDGEYAFSHLTFQEFLTADYIVDNNSDHLKAIKAYWNNDWYKEVLELYIGYLSISHRSTANSIVESAINSDDELPYKKWRLVGRAFLDIHVARRDGKVREKIIERMLEIRDRSKEPTVLVDAGEISGWLGDKRDLKAFINIKGGEYNLEGAGKTVLNSFEIGKYPVTNIWFRDFIDAGAYLKQEFWSIEGMKWLEEIYKKQPEFWNDRKWKCPNSPVVGISWYEAHAFTKWLTLISDDGYEYRLPDELEWQAAAAGFENRKYAWGNEWDKDKDKCKKCNNEELGTGKTSPVGFLKKGDSPEGISDLAGNVLEWTSTEYLTREVLADFKKEQQPVLRGGSWKNGTSSSCMSSARLSQPPHERFAFTGFRCARTLKK